VYYKDGTKSYKKQTKQEILKIKIAAMQHILSLFLRKDDWLADY